MVYGKLIIDGNAVYEIDEQCMEKRRQRLEMLRRQEQAEEARRGSAQTAD